MRVVVVGENTCLGAGLRVHLLRWGRHEIATLSTKLDRWKSERKLRKSLRRLSPDILIDLRFSSILGDKKFLNSGDLENTEWIAKTCVQERICMFYISSPIVFSGNKIRPYEEADSPDPVNTSGVLLLENEDKIRQICEKHIILRLGPIFAAYGSNILTHLISRLDQQNEMHCYGQKIECPLHASDAARVISGIIDQISAGANEVGTYHYCGLEAVSSYDFAEAVISSLLQFKFIQTDITSRLTKDDDKTLNFALDCTKIQNNFAIRQMSWKQSLSEAVKNYYSER